VVDFSSYKIKIIIIIITSNMKLLTNKQIIKEAEQPKNISYKEHFMSHSQGEKQLGLPTRLPLHHAKSFLVIG
jgi:hypothetical protein